MSTKENPGKFDCYGRAMPHEEMFTVLGRDRTSPKFVLKWAKKRMTDIAKGKAPESDLAMVAEAVLCAKRMKRWRAENNGKWRTRDLFANMENDPVLSPLPLPSNEFVR